MSEQCACGNASGTNDECERCRLIDQLKAAQNRVAELERANRVLDSVLEETKERAAVRLVFLNNAIEVCDAVIRWNDRRLDPVLPSELITDLAMVADGEIE